MMDISVIEDFKDMVVMDQVVMKASNVVAIQIGDLSYNTDFGIDKRYFLQDNIAFQNESFQSHVVERLSQYQISVSSVIEIIEELQEIYSYNVGESDVDNNIKGLIR